MRAEKPADLNQGHKNTILHLQFRRLSLADYAILGTYALLVITSHVLTALDPADRYMGLIFIPMAAWYVTTSTPIGLRFRNVYFFCSWLVLCLAVIPLGTAFSLLPLACFLLYQAVRLLFWKNHYCEFIPFTVVRGDVFPLKNTGPRFLPYRSKAEGRMGAEVDKRYMKWYFFLGFLLFITLLFGLTNRNLSEYHSPFSI